MRGRAVHDLPGKQGEKDQDHGLRRVREARPRPDPEAHFTGCLDRLEHWAVVRSQPAHAVICPFRQRQADGREGIEQTRDPGPLSGSPLAHAQLGGADRLDVAVDGDRGQNDAQSAHRGAAEIEPPDAFQHRCGLAPRPRSSRPRRPSRATTARSGSRRPGSVGLASGNCVPKRTRISPGSEGARGFDEIFAHLADAEIGQADQRRDREEAGHDDARRVADPEEHDHGHQIDEAGDGLQQVKKGAQHPEEPVAARGQNADRNPQEVCRS